MKKRFASYEGRLLVLSVLLVAFYLGIAYFFHAPKGYYGTIEQPRFADPWLARTETILNGGVLYRDVFTTTPPLTNLLLIVPSVVSGWFGHLNPWSTLSFMLYFSLFNLFAALVLLYMGKTREVGYKTAVFFLLNPLTFGNTILRRQDESIIVFFIAVSILFFLRQQHVRSALAIGAAMLVKLTGAVTLPIALLHSRNWRYLLFPFLLFALVMLPFLLAAGRDAMFWDVSKRETQHPFQFDGVSLGSLWNRYHEEAEQVPLEGPAVLFVVGVGLTAVYLTQKSHGFLEDLTLLVAVVLILSPKLHTGYFSMLALTMAPLAQRYRFTASYFLFGTFAIVADFYKWPIENFPIAFNLMVITFALLLFALIQIIRLQPKQVAVP